MKKLTQFAVQTVFVGAVFIFTFFSFTSVTVKADGFTGAGDGLAPETAFIITSCDELQEMNLDLSSYFKLDGASSTIDCSATSGWNSDGGSGFYGFEPIGDTTTPFAGHLDGNNNVITHLYINRPGENWVGLFSAIDSGATVSDFGLTGVDITGYYHVGGLVGSLSGTVTNVYTTGNVVGNGNGIGGLVGSHVNNNSWNNSSPLVYTWNGDKYKYVADVGNLLPKEVSNAPDLATIDKGDLVPQGDKYSMKISEEYNEIVYYDQLSLSTYDHQPGYSIAVPLNRTATASDIKTVSDTPTNPLLSCIDMYGHDCLNDLKDNDNKWAYKDPSFVNSWIMDFGNLANKDSIQLVMRGARDYAASAKMKANNTYTQLRTVEVKDANGAWVQIYNKNDLGSDGTPRLRTIDLTGKFLSDDYHVKVGFDTFNANYFAVDTSAQVPVTVNTYHPTKADLSFRGFTDIDNTYFADHNYDKVSPTPLEMFKPQFGNFTKYGDVSPLLQSENNQFVIMHPGDHMDVEFPYTAPVDGMERSFVLNNDAWYKHASNDSIGLLGKTVNPLPYTGMTSYTSDTNGYPMTPENIDYINTWNTRVYDGTPKADTVAGSTIINSYSSASVTGDYYVGGLVGYNEKEIRTSYASGDVTSVDNYVGGLVGWNNNNGALGWIHDSYARGNVIGGYYGIGGLVGENHAVIDNSYSTGLVTGNDISTNNGLVGSNCSGCGGEVNNSFWDTETSGQNTNNVATGKSTTEMKNVATFTDNTTVGLDTPWDFVANPNDDLGTDNIWNINGTDNNGYPFLSWQTTFADISHVNKPEALGASGAGTTYGVSAITYSPVALDGDATVIDFANNYSEDIDDNITDAIELPFAFNFYGLDYNNIYISTNGFVTFNDQGNDGCCSGSSIPDFSEGAPHNIIAAYWTDLIQGGTVSYETFGTAPNRTFVINYDGGIFYDQQYDNTDVYPDETTFQSQIILYEGSNNIEIHTTKADNTGHEDLIATQGIENIDGSQGLTLAGRNDRLSFPLTDDAVRFTPTITQNIFRYIDGPTLTWNPDGVPYTVNATSFDAGDFLWTDGDRAGSFDAGTGLWTAGLSGAMGEQDETNNNLSVTVTDSLDATHVYTSTNNYTIDTEVPADFTTGAVTPTGGTLVEHQWNDTNTGLSVVTPVPDDSSLIGGHIQVQALLEGDYDWQNTGDEYEIVGPDIGSDTTINFVADDLTVIPGWGSGAYAKFRSVITDPSRNISIGSMSADRVDFLQTGEPPTGEWKLDEKSGTVADDSSENGNNDGEVSGSAKWVSGRVNNAFSFNGSSNYITIGRPVTDIFSICAWIKTNTKGSGTDHWRVSPIMNSEVPDLANDFGFGVDSDGHIAYGNGGGFDATVNGHTNVANNSWHYVCATRDSDNGEAKVYVDGAEDGSGETSTDPLFSQSESRIGYGFDGSMYFKGLIDEIQVYPRVLLADEISQLYHAFPREKKTSSGGGASAGVINAFLQNNKEPLTFDDKATLPTDCASGYKFSPSTGKACVGSSSISPSTNSNPSSPTHFSKTLKQGMNDADVKALQIFLNTHGFVVATTGMGSSGHETNYFGKKTKDALKKFQQSHPPLTADGVMGPQTMAVINSL